MGPHNPTSDGTPNQPKQAVKENLEIFQFERIRQEDMEEVRKEVGHFIFA